MRTIVSVLEQVMQLVGALLGWTSNAHVLARVMP